MENAEILHTVAEVSVALAGFTSVAAVLGPRAMADWPPSDLIRLSLLLRASLATLVLCLLPLILTSLHLSEALSWSLASAVMGANIVYSGVWARATMQRLSPQERRHFPRAGIAALNVSAAVVFIALLLNIAGFVFERESGPFLLGLYWLLGFSALQFLRLLLALIGRGEGGA